MKKCIYVLFLMMLFLCSCSEKNESTYEKITLNEQTVEQLQINQTESAYTPVNFSRHKAVWFTMMDFEKAINNKSCEEFTTYISEAVEKIKDTGFNTVYLHIRPYNNAYYLSEILPPAKGCTNEYDPLEIFLEKAHEQGLSVHGWINPLRCQNEEEMKALDEKYLIKKWYNDNEKKNSCICMVDDRWYLNPAYSEVREYICSGVLEVIEKYEVDGMHIDDYFYPTTQESFDKKAFEESGYTDLQQFRLDNINTLVSEIYTCIKEHNKNLLFGISPQGNVSINYSSLYADVDNWCGSVGYCDYIVPQLYYGFRNESLPFEETLFQWKGKVCEDVKLVSGICTYKIGTEDKWAGSGSDEWINDKNIPSRQIEMSFDNDVSIAVYSYESLFKKENGSELLEIEKILKQE